MNAVSTVLSRRNVGCISDLTIDRWLLGEGPQAEEARRVETHLRGCSNCASRAGALRGLYSAQPIEASHEPPVRINTPPASVPGQTGALQIVILRDGLLVGSEYFTPGSYEIGSNARADLRLEGVARQHGRLFFRDDRVAVQAGQGALLVNGFNVESAEVRPIDEIIVGPYVLRSRVIRERWSDPVTELVAAAVPEETVIEPPPSSRNALRAGRSMRVTLELWWGQSLQDARSFQADVTAQEFPLWGFEVAERFVVAQRTPAGRFVVGVPRGAKVSRESLSLGAGERLCVSLGTMRLVVSVDAVLPSLPVGALVHWPTASLSAVLLATVVLAAAMTPVPDESPFTAVDSARVVHPFLPPNVPRPSPVVLPAPDASRPGPSRPAHAPRGAGRSSTASPASRTCWGRTLSLSAGRSSLVALASGARSVAACSQRLTASEGATLAPGLASTRTALELVRLACGVSASFALGRPVRGASAGSSQRSWRVCRGRITGPSTETRWRESSPTTSPRCRAVTSARC